MIADDWLASHPYLHVLADLHATVESAASKISPSNTGELSFEDYRDDFLTGVPVLHSSTITIDWTPVEGSFQGLVQTLAASDLPGRLTEEIHTLYEELITDPDASRRVVASLLAGGDLMFTSPGLLRYLGWTAISRYLRLVMAAFERWRDEEQWLRRYCPTCGSPPAMAQLVGAEQGRRRLLYCGFCSTRWHYRRSMCPFCENTEDSRREILTVEGEGGLHIDYCKSCNGYLKTYAGEGREAVLLADWTSIHLDLVARERGLERLAASLYDV